MIVRRIKFSRLAPAGAAACLALGGCIDAAIRDTYEAVEKPVRAVSEGVDTLTGGVIGKLLTDRSRRDLLRELRELRAHLAKVEKEAERKNIREKDFLLVRGARDRLAAAGRQLGAQRIPLDLGLRVAKQFDKVRATFGLLSQQYNTSPYEGFIAPL
jgi:hypothetical protein